MTVPASGPRREPVPATFVTILPGLAAGRGAREESVSPSLLGVGGTASYELKFRLVEAVAGQVELWARQHLAFDAHADAALGNAYRIHSLYLDTAALDVYHRTPSFGRRKFRLRRYGNECGLYLERKTRSGDRVVKRRTPIADTELGRLAEEAADPAWAGDWFQRRLLARGLRPACLISYDRVAHVGTSAEGPLRFDAGPADSRHADARVACHRGTPGVQLFPGQVVLELKYRASLPALFKQLLREFNLSPQPASKYRRCVETWGSGGQTNGVRLVRE